MHVIYRISNNSYSKKRLSYASKEFCLQNFVSTVLTHDDQMTIIADAVDESLERFIKKFENDKIIVLKKNLKSNGACFRYQLDYCLTLPKDEIVLFQEDDYLYKPSHWPYEQAQNITYASLITDCLKMADYVSFYDHPDKYIAPALGGNPFIDKNGVENTGVFLTKNSHWKYTNSTTCTFATTVKTIQKDINVWKTFCPGDHPHDYQSFVALGLKGRKLATSIPGKSTHCDIEYLSPFHHNQQPCPY